MSFGIIVASTLPVSVPAWQYDVLLHCFNANLTNVDLNREMGSALFLKNLEVGLYGTLFALYI